MLYDIGLRIKYAYQTPAAGGRHVLCMTPAEMGGPQRRQKRRRTQQKHQAGEQ